MAGENVGKKKYCIRCGKTMDINNFYRSNNFEKYPDGYVDVCKDCFVARMDPWDPDTYIPLLQECDVPYLPDIWNGILQQNSDPKKVKTVLGKYVGRMKLKNYKDYRFADSEHLLAVEEKKAREALEKQGKSAAEIDDILAQPTIVAPPKPVILDSDESFGGRPALSAEEVNAEEMALLGFDLTDEDKAYLRIKWGNSYRPFEWVQLERLYQDMMGSYDIQTAGHKDTLKLICKTSLKANQLFDLGDIDGATKAVKMYDSLMKSGKFTAAQNKAEVGEYVDSVSEIAMMCEKDGFIPRFYQDEPNDKVDYVIKDNQTYIHKLITEETNLGDMIEHAIREIEEDKTLVRPGDADEGGDDDSFAEELFAEEQTELTDEDLIAFREYEDELARADKRFLEKESEKGAKLSRRHDIVDADNKANTKIADGDHRSTKGHGKEDYK